MEIGGYFELETNYGKEYHGQAIALNCGRRALSCVVELRRYHKVYVSTFNCNSVYEGLKFGGAEIEFYEVDRGFSPLLELALEPDKAVVITNYYGQLTDEEILKYKKKYGNIILDNTQAFFHKPSVGIDTVYSCRKFFGVPDGAYLVTNAKDLGNYQVDFSCNRMEHVLGRFEYDAGSFYQQASNNNEIFEKEPIKYMSKLTHNILRGIDYEAVAKKRTENATFLHRNLNNRNRSNYNVPYGAFMYPLFVDKGEGAFLRKYLQKNGVFVPCLWPDVLKRESQFSIAYELADDIIPLPCDHRYGVREMEYILTILEKYGR